MSTKKDRYYENMLLQLVSERVITLPMLQEIRGELIAHKWSRDLINCIYQNRTPSEPTNLEAMVILYTLNALRGQIPKELRNKMPRVVAFQIPVGIQAFKDHQANAINKVLRNLPSPFRGKFTGGPSGEDGYIAWDRPIHAQRTETLENGINCISWVLLRPGDVDLEVGTNTATKFMHCIQASQQECRRPGIARWPYLSEFITVFMPTMRTGFDVDLTIRTFPNGMIVSPSDKNFEGLLKDSGETLSSIPRERSAFMRWLVEEGAELNKR